MRLPMASRLPLLETVLAFILANQAPPSDMYYVVIIQGEVAKYNIVCEQGDFWPEGRWYRHIYLVQLRIDALMVCTLTIHILNVAVHCILYNISTKYIYPAYDVPNNIP